MVRFRCWNCQQTTHKYPRCQRPMSVFCFKCWEPGFSSLTCPYCVRLSSPSFLLRPFIFPSLPFLAALFFPFLSFSFLLLILFPFLYLPFLSLCAIFSHCFLPFSSSSLSIFIPHLFFSSSCFYKNRFFVHLGFHGAPIYIFFYSWFIF